MKEATPIQEKESRAGDLIWWYRQPLIVAIHVVGGLVALCAPDNVLSSSEHLHNFVVVVNTLLPIVFNAAHYSEFPEVTKLYGAMMLCTSPYWVYVTLQRPDLEKVKEKFLRKASSTLGKRILLHVLPFLMPLILYVFFFKAEITDLHVAPFQHERWALAVFGPILYCWMATGIYSLVVVPVQVLIRLWKGE